MLNPTPQQPTPDELYAIQQRQQAIAEIEKALRVMRVSVLTEDDDGEATRRPAPIGVLQAQGQQSLAIYAALTEQALTDILLSMRIAASDFAQKNVLVVPVLVNRQERVLMDLSERMLKSKLLNQESVALPAASNEEEKAAWGSIFADEFAEADLQGMGEQAEAQGLALLVRSSGEVARRGVGRPVWKTIFRELDV